MTDPNKTDPHAPPTALRPAAAGTLPRFDSVELLGTATAVVIVHNGREYLLRVTQNGKLILTA